MFKRAPGWQDAVLNALVIACCVLVPLIWWSWQLGPIRPAERVRFFNNDQFGYTVPTLQFESWMLRQGIFPLWNPYQLCGTPFLATQNHGILYPPYWLALFLPLPQALRILMFAHYILAMGAAYWCARVFGVSRPAALLAGVGYAFSGSLFNAGVARMQPHLTSAAWLPLQLALTRVILMTHSRRAAVALGVATALSFLGGHPQYLLLSVQLCGAYVIAHLALAVYQSGWATLFVPLTRLSLAALIALGISAAQLLPTMQLMLSSPRRPGALATVGGNDAWPFFLAARELPQNILSPMRGTFGLAGEGYVAVVVLGLAPVPLLWPGRRRSALFLWAAAVGAALVALGNQSPIYQWYLELPGSGLFRYPERCMVVVTLCLALVGAIGADTLWRQRAHELALSLAAGASAIAILCFLGWRPADAAVTQLLKLKADIALFLVWGSLFTFARRGFGEPWCAGLIAVAAAVSVIELYRDVEVQWTLPTNQPDALRVPSAAAAFVRERQGFARTFAPNPPFQWGYKPGIPLKLGMLTGLSVISDYEALFDQRYATLLEQLGGERRPPAAGYQGPRVSSLGPAQWPLLRMLGVGFVLVRRDAGIAVGLSPPIYTDAEYAVYEVRDPLPRAFVATKVRYESVPGRGLADVVSDTGFVLEHGAIVEGDADADLHATGNVEITRYGNHLVELRATLSSRGLVVLHDQFDANWVATVDGRAAEIFRTNYVFRGVPVDAGEHTIRFAYHPMPFYVGTAITLTTLLGLLLAGVLAVRSIRARSD